MVDAVFPSPFDFLLFDFRLLTFVTIKDSSTVKVDVNDALFFAVLLVVDVCLFREYFFELVLEREDSDTSSTIRGPFELDPPPMS